MSNNPSSKLMDTAPGGENTQYEGAKVFMDQTSSGTKSQSQLKDELAEDNQFQTSRDTTHQEESEADKQIGETKQARGKKTTENIRFGEAISEHGFGGQTAGIGGGVDTAKGKNDNSGMRKVMGYGEGSGVGG